jgi:hypothetical protein
MYVEVTGWYLERCEREERECWSGVGKVSGEHRQVSHEMLAREYMHWVWRRRVALHESIHGTGAGLGRRSKETVGCHPGTSTQYTNEWELGESGERRGRIARDAIAIETV